MSVPQALSSPPPALPLRGYQEAAIAASVAAEQRGIRRQLIVMPTGTGKTVVFAHIVRRRRGRILILVHRDELVQQTLSKLRAIVPGLVAGVIKAERNDTDAQVMVASVQTLARPNRLAQLPPAIELAIVDEAHHGPAESYRRVLEHVGSFAPDGPTTIGFTATPERADGQALGDVFEEIVYSMGLLEAIQNQFLSGLRAVQVKLAINFGAIRTRQGDYAPGELADALDAANAPDHAVTAWHEHAAGRPTVVFTPTVAMAQAMAAAFRAAGVAAEELDGTTPTDERRAILRRLSTGETMIVANCGVLTEGFDEPRISCIVIARPTQSRPLYAQMIGRGTRLHPGKDDCLILDMVGSTTRHDLQTTASLFGVDPDEIATKGVVDAVTDRDEREQAETQQRVVAGRLVAVRVDLFQRRPLHWISGPGGVFLLVLGDGHLELVPDAGDTWRVVDVPRHGAPMVIAEGLPLGFAQGRAEDIARDVGAGALLNPDAAWRQRPATAKQIGLLRKQRVPVPPGCTSGQASDLIAASFAHRALSA